MTSQIEAWRRAADAPFDRDLELAVIDEDGAHALIFACRRVADGWVKSDTGAKLSVEPTHWRAWSPEG
ncbi:MAG: hypothetical protein AB7H66_08395 [Hyphomonadaceae bacterium]